MQKKYKEQLRDLTKWRPLICQLNTEQQYIFTVKCTFLRCKMVKLHFPDLRLNYVGHLATKDGRNAKKIEISLFQYLCGLASVKSTLFDFVKEQNAYLK